MNRTLAAMVVVLIVAGPGEAGWVKFTFSYDDYGLGPGTDPGKWVVYASVSQGDNDGLSLFGMVIVNATTVTNFSPKVMFIDPQEQLEPYQAGFTQARSLSGASLVTGVQDRLGMGAKPILVYGFGHSGGDLLLLNPDPGIFEAIGPVQTTYGAPLILARGTYTAPTTPTFYLASEDNRAWVFRSSALPGVVGFMRDWRSTPTQLVFTPEPATLALMGLGGLALVVRRRRG